MLLPFLRSLRRSVRGAMPAAAPRCGVETAVAAVATNGDRRQVFTFKKIGPGQIGRAATDARTNPADIDVWVVPADAMPQLARQQNVLTDAERRHADRITYKPHRTRYMAVRTVLRHALSHRMENAIKSDQWRISSSVYGKPQLSPEQANCSFSVTHADEFSVVAIAPGATVGIDAEKVDHSKLRHLPFECLSENERNRISAQAQDRQYFDFFRLWTLKEAYTKALGMGLAREFDTIEFDLDCDDKAPVSADAGMADAENYELLTLNYLNFDHLLAICLLGVADGNGARPAKNLYVVDPCEPTAETLSTNTENLSKEKKMPALLHIVDQKNPERVELYSLEDLPDLLHESFEQQARETPHEAALECGGEILSYGELDARANQVANYLIGRGVRSGDRVVLYHEKSVDLFIWLLGSLKANAVYVPVDPKFTSKEVIGVVAQHDPRFILTSRNLCANLPDGVSEKVVLVDEAKHCLVSISEQSPLFGTGCVTTDDDSHVVFKPNAMGGRDAIAVSHGEAVRFIWSLASVYGLQAHHRYHQDPSLAFDVALEEALAVLSSGATIVAGRPDTDRSCEAMARFIAERRITVLSTTPEVLEAFKDELPTVDVLIVGGRVCPSDLAVHWALRTKRVVSLKRAGNRFPCFSIEQESGAAWRPRMLHAHASERPAA